jgi:predicted acylesterase/phospholipase RssA
MKKKDENIINELRRRYGKWRHSEEKKESRLGIFDVLNESIDLTQESLAKLLLEKHKPDLTIKVSRKVCGTMDFHKTSEILALGREAYYDAVKNTRSF